MAAKSSVSGGGHTSKDTKKMLCSSNCKSEYQDSKHGKGIRVFNPAKGNVYHCTVCGAKREA